MQHGQHLEESQEDHCLSANLTEDGTYLLQAGGDLPEAFAVLGFAFYVQPMLMPLLHELPPGPASVSLTATAVRIVVIGVASLVRLLHDLRQLLQYSLPVSYYSS